jgi:hypothetical protein
MAMPIIIGQGGKEKKGETNTRTEERRGGRRKE